MDGQTKRELRIAAALTAGSYLPAVALLAHAVPLGAGISPWLSALCLTAAMAFFLAIDVLLPLGRSKVGMLDALVGAVWRSMRRDDGWYLRVMVIMTVVIAMQVALDLATHS